ncbi:hypothetical protein [Actibacterium sp. 188UL27-1]|uniref:hypothetical protein n=1 Tax=Actibacterium sp. 188UL27-1 TaxID=2786961 RepID=UPI0019563E07|nr:hypothetical protein [Actibacterium sp. 188UL27-1]MBM7069438.1 hypothetical protein [Actibacterium sp. 188UL27-1]
MDSTPEQIDDLRGSSSQFLDWLNAFTDRSVGFVEKSADAYFAGRHAVESVQRLFGWQDPDTYAMFDPVGVRKPQETITDFSIADIEFLKDSVNAARHGSLDESKLFQAGLVDDNGYIVDTPAFFGEAELNWGTSEINWAASEFDLIRVREETGFVRGEGPYEANVALLYNVETDAYTISIGGTQGLADVNTDIWGLVFNGNTLSHGAAMTQIIDQFFEEDIPEGADVVLVGHSLGGGEALLQYRLTPDRFDQVVPIQTVGIGGDDGTYFDQYLWDKVGDAKIFEIFGDDPDTDFNDAVTYWGHVGAGTVYDIAGVGSDGGIELLDSHLLDGVWTALPSGEDPVTIA